jgi:2'-5' RNA ligase
VSESLYFLAIVPPQEIQDRITQLKHEVADKFGSQHALNASPHITLHMPFKWKDKKKDQLMNVLERINEKVTPFEIELKDFGFFEPRVVFVNVVENESLNQLQKFVTSICKKELKLDNANYKDRPFHPHATIAFRDLKKSKFYEAREYFEAQKFDEKFNVMEMHLLKHDEGKWNVIEV